jgi:predicted dehydrogenase
MIWLIGTGPMARDYARVCVAQGLDFTVVGRDRVKAERFAEEFKTSRRVAGVIAGGVDHALALVAQKQAAAPTHAIVAAPIDALAPIAHTLAPHCPAILLEKPGALEVAELRALAELPTVRSGACQISIGYNRRFYAGIDHLRQQIENDGPVLSATLEFDEPIPRIEALPTDAAIKARWGYANASHVFDILFHLCGPSSALHVLPAQPSDPALSWHPSGSVFVGAGLTETGTRYIYHGNFGSVGRWRLALSMRKRRYLLMPLETLQVAEGMSVAFTDVPLPTAASADLKPGLGEQVSAFMAGDPHKRLAGLPYQMWHMAYLASVFGYPK